MAINLSALTAYVDENSLPLIRKTILDGETVKHLQIMTGVKGATALNLLDTTISLGNGKACGFSAAGSDTFTQREVTPAAVKINKSYCHRSMLDYWMNNQVRVAAGDTGLPFEQEFAEGVVKKTNVEIEKAVWQGITVNSVAYPGFIQILTEDTDSTTEGVQPAGTQVSAGATIYATTMAVYNAIPADTLEETAIFMGRDQFRLLVQELIAKNLYNYATDLKDSPAFELVLPGTNMHVYGVKGLDGTYDSKHWVIALNLAHAFYATDMRGDEERFKFWYSEDNDEYRLALAFNFGVQVAYPEENVFANFS